MKIACSSASFARELETGELTELDWLDLCANELEVDGVVFAAERLSRTDADYLAQLKKTAADLGLTVAGLASESTWHGSGAASLFESALALGAPLLLVQAPATGADARAWGSFTEELGALAGAAKQANVTLALRNAPETLCATVADLRRAAKDVDSSWLRFALAAASFGTADAAETVLPRTVVVLHAIAEPDAFATPDDSVASDLIVRLARFRGFIVLDRAVHHAARAGFHAALERFTRQRERALVASAPGSP